MRISRFPGRSENTTDEHDKLTTGTTSAELSAGTLRVNRPGGNWAGVDVNGTDGGFFSVYEDGNYLSSHGTYVTGGVTEDYNMPGYDYELIVGATTDVVKIKTDTTLALQVAQTLSTFWRSILLTPTAGDPAAANGQIWYNSTTGKFRVYQGGAAMDMVSAALAGVQGDIQYHNGTSWVALNAGTAGFVLKTGGAGANPSWTKQEAFNYNTANQGPGFATDTYVTGSNVLIPAQGVKVGSMYKATIRVTKTAAGAAAAVLTLRWGTAGTIADTARCTFTFTAGSAAADDGIYEVWMHVVTDSATGVIKAAARLTHRLSITGFSTMVSETEMATSGAFDTTVANSYIGLSLNGGASAAWTVDFVQAELNNLD